MGKVDYPLYPGSKVPGELTGSKTTSTFTTGRTGSKYDPYVILWQQETTWSYDVLTRQEFFRDLGAKGAGDRPRTTWTRLVGEKPAQDLDVVRSLGVSLLGAYAGFVAGQGVRSLVWRWFRAMGTLGRLALLGASPGGWIASAWAVRAGASAISLALSEAAGRPTALSSWFDAFGYGYGLTTAWAFYNDPGAMWEETKAMVARSAVNIAWRFGEQFTDLPGLEILHEIVDRMGPLPAPTPFAQSPGWTRVPRYPPFVY